jgi:hypothetical protein
MVMGVGVKPRTGALRLTFDLGGRLDLWPIEQGSKDDVWLLYQQDDAPILSVRADGRFAYCKSPDREEWRPIE